MSEKIKKRELRVMLDEKDYRELKVKCAKLDSSITNMIKELIKKFIEKK